MTKEGAQVGNSENVNRRINAAIRRAAGHWSATDPAERYKAPPPQRADAFAGNGAAGPGPDVRSTAEKMNSWIRDAQRNRSYGK
jgi:hypothetical protein